ncbi:MAG: spore cortex-lytic enzyme [Firmicutes bacterium]|nr:spore cortex-lytic enzyme [Bacillota bacterium]
MWRKKSVWIISCLIINLFILGATTKTSAANKATPSPLKYSASVKQNSSTTNSKLKHLQQLLADTGFYPGSMTGLLDVTTKEAITSAQKALKLKQTGQYDPKLADLLTQEAKNKPQSYLKKLSLQATAYTSQDPGCGNLTKREHYLRKGLVAVDPKIIPLGTRLYIEGYGYAIADDIGSAIKGNKIDLAYENRKDAFSFGRKTVTVFVLN